VISYPPVKEAYLFEELEDKKVRCNLCNHRCVIAEGKRGRCEVRENKGGKLYSLVYGKLISANVDPIEKKPFFHFLPGSTAFSIATVGCNFRCQHCQNYEISQMPKDQGRIVGREVEPKEIVRRAVEYGCSSISYTYTEPTIFFEYAYDTAEIAQGEGLKNTFVTNGFMTPEALEMISPYLDAANVDLKSFREDFYREVCSAHLRPVLENIERMKALGIWVEVTTLVIPTLNDSEEELRQIARFIRSVGPEIPWHVTAFHPDYTMLDKPRTPVETLKRAREIGFEEGLRYVYSGNVPGDEGENTYCWNCHRMIIRRWGFQVLEKRIEGGHCTFCGASIDGVGM